MPTVIIMGAGDLGGAVAQGLAAGSAATRVILVDAAAGVAAGKALDIQQAGAISGAHVRLEGSDDPTRAAGAAVCVVADRAGQPSSEWTGDEGLALLRRILPFIEHMPIVFAGAAQADLLLMAAREERVSRTRLIGSAAEAYASGLRSMVALEAGCSASEVGLTVFGVPPAHLVVPWSEASIGGLALERVLDQVQLTRLESRASRLWPPGPYALGLAAARTVEAVIRSSRRALSVLTVLEGEFGVRSRVGAVPARFDPRGIARLDAPALTTRERVLVETALGA